ncbi:MAG: hypothetical protein KGL62_10335, partial [Bradyrhizobium sp.]|uniref:hypothetical protein n=1 Tax=Bradyrhizobium sp. TaxID=376 RepID=UPI0023964AAE
APAPAPHPAANSEPIIGPVATATAVVTGKQVPEITQHQQTSEKPGVPAPVPVAAPAIHSIPASSNPPAPAASPPMMGPPDPAAAKLVEPEPAKTVSMTAPTAPSPSAQPAQATPKPAPEAAAPAPASDKSTADKPATEKIAANAPPAPSAQVPSAQVAVNRTEFGVDVGGANSVGGLRALWRGLLKSRSNAPLATLQPIIVVKERTNGLGMQLRLVAGPLTDAAAAARICAHMAENNRPCTTTVFDGQRLAMRAPEASGSTGAISARPSSEKEKPEEKSSEPAETGKSVAEEPVSPKSVSGRHTWHHRHYSKRAVVEEPPKQPEPTTSPLSSIFSRR